MKPSFSIRGSRALVIDSVEFGFTMRMDLPFAMMEYFTESNWSRFNCAKSLESDHMLQVNWRRVFAKRVTSLSVRKVQVELKQQEKECLFGKFFSNRIVEGERSTC